MIDLLSPQDKPHQHDDSSPVFFIPHNHTMLYKTHWVEWRLGAAHHWAWTVMMALVISIEPNGTKKHMHTYCHPPIQNKRCDVNPPGESRRKGCHSSKGARAVEHSRRSCNFHYDYYLWFCSEGSILRRTPPLGEPPPSSYDKWVFLLIRPSKNGSYLAKLLAHGVKSCLQPITVKRACKGQNWLNIYVGAY